ncbi:MAG: hypothetical protein Q8P23_01170 [bacterium]|nr:hypothetical protein [bacterium]
MATTKERILITLAPSTARALRARARQEQTPRATIAAQFVELGLLEVPILTLSSAGESRALRAVRTYDKERRTGILKEIIGSLADLA